MSTETTSEIVDDAPVTAPISTESTNQTPLPEVKDPKKLRLFYEPPGTLRLTVGDGRGAYSYHTVKMYQAAPLSMRGKFLSLQDGKSEEITLIPALADLPLDSQEVAEEEIRRRYLTATVKAISSIKTEFGITYWHVSTDRGERDFVVQSLSESCVWLSDSHILLIDADGNRFEIPDRFALDPPSLEHLSTVL